MSINETEFYDERTMNYCQDNRLESILGVNIYEFFVPWCKIIQLK